MSKDAGIADPYWYEWSVGLKFILEMLNPDSGIEHVTLQKTGIKGLDDVVVKYNDGTLRQIQVKHTRAGDTLTFGDLVTASEKDDNESGDKRSVLRAIASAWKDAKDHGVHCKPEVYTNRNIGIKASSTKTTAASDTTPAASYIKRPALAKFWPEVNRQAGSAANLSDIDVGQEWVAAWREWLEQLQDLSDNEKLEFLRTLKISADQPDLSALERELLTSIQEAFSISESQAVSVFQKLDHALREWTTSRRNTESISRESVFAALSLGTEQEIGDHRLPPPEPFFGSRVDFANNLAGDLIARTRPIVFLTGEPGAGKTSIISSLINRRDPTIDLRFFAYRPIGPSSALLPADAGRTTTARALWGDLLIQLRALLRGRLAKFRVPIRNEFLDVDGLRDHVLRLAGELAIERDRTTVIAIDGIDHAARAGIMATGNLLDSLVPPQSVPQRVTFLIAGQPGNDRYPLWLRAPHDDVARKSIAPITQNDVQTLVSKFVRSLPDDELDTATRLIHSSSGGNTLAAVFAVHEANFCNTVTELETRLQSRKLGDGIIAYYNTIWTAAVAPLERSRLEFPLYLAGAFALSSSRLDGSKLARIYSKTQIGETEWQSALKKLRPLISEDPGGFRVFHNDVRVYLHQKLGAEPEIVPPIASSFADYYTSDPTCVREKHSDLFRLLRMAGRSGERAVHFYPRYVLEGWAHDQSISELIEQAKIALESAIEYRNWDVLHQVVCAVATLKQLKASLEWLNDGSGVTRSIAQVPPVLPSEGRVVHVSQWTVEMLTAVVDDARYLCDAGENDRGRGIVKRWFAQTPPSAIITALPEREVIKEAYHPQQKGKDLSEQLVKLMRKLGQTVNICGTIWDDDANACSDLQQQALAECNGGSLAAAAMQSSKVHWARTFIWMGRQCFYWRDIEAGVTELADAQRWVEVAFSLKRLRRAKRRLSASFRVRAASWALLLRRQDMERSWTRAVARAGFTWLQKIDLPRENELLVWCSLCFVKGWVDRHRDPSNIGSDATIAYFNAKGRDDRARGHTAQLLQSAVLVGRWFCLCRRERRDAIDMQEVKRIVHLLLNPDWNRPAYIAEGFHPCVDTMLACIVEIARGVGVPALKVVRDEFEGYALGLERFGWVQRVWSFLEQFGDRTRLRQWAEYWIGPNGKAWTSELSDRHGAVNTFAPLCIKSGFQSIADEAHSKLMWGAIGYASHKEYSLYEPIEWYKDLRRSSAPPLESRGLQLLAVSAACSQMGDNRAAYDLEREIVHAFASRGIGRLHGLMRSVDSTKFRLAAGAIIEGLLDFAKEHAADVVTLGALWAINVALIPWQTHSYREFLANIRTALTNIATSAVTRGNFEAFLRLSPLESSFAPPSPGDDSFSRKYDHNRKQLLMTLLGGVGYEQLTGDLLVTNFVSSAPAVIRNETSIGAVWDAVVFCINKIAQGGRRPTDKEIAGLLAALKERDIVHPGKGWSSDGMKRAVAAIFQHLPDAAQWDLVQMAINGPIDDGIDYWLGNVVEDLGLLCRKRLAPTDSAGLDAGLERLLKMHELWLEGDGQLPSIIKPISPITDDDDCKDILQFAARLLIGRIHSRSASQVQSILRGLWLLEQLQPGTTDCIYAPKQAYSAREMCWLLALAELTVHANPNISEPLARFVEKSFMEGDVEPALQAWTVLQAAARGSGASPRLSWEDRYSAFHGANTGPLIVAVGPQLLDVPSEVNGAVISTVGVSAAKHTLERLEDAAHEDVADIESRLRSSLIANPDGRNAQMRSDTTRRGDMVISQDDECSALLGIIHEDMSKGRFRDVPPIRLVQSLAHCDEPFVVIPSPTPSLSSEWPIDRRLDELLLGTEQELEDLLIKVANAGVDDGYVLGSAQLITHSNDVDVVLVISHFWHANLYSDPSRAPRSTMSGRFCALYDLARFEPQSPSGVWLWLVAGGLYTFPAGSPGMFPSKVLQNRFGWQPSARDPRVWMCNKKFVAKFDNIAGPVRNDYDSGFYRQPTLRRWTVLESALDEARKRLGGRIARYVDVHVARRNERE